MIRAPALRMCALAALVVLAGCLDGPALRLKSSISELPDPSGYTWYAPTFTDAQGEPTESLGWWSEADAPRYVQQLLAGEGVEPMVMATPASDTVFVSALDYVHRTTDAGLQWDVARENQSPGVPVAGDRYETTETASWRDPITGRYFVSHYGRSVNLLLTNAGSCNILSWTDDEGATWTDGLTSSAPGACPMPFNAYGFVSQHKLLTAPPGPDAVADPQGYPNVLYSCATLWLVQFPVCAVSLNGGDSYHYASPVPIPDPNCALTAIGQPTAWPDGTVVIPFGDTGTFLYWGGILPSLPECQGRRAPTVAISRDNGLTWTLRTFPGDLVQAETEPGISIAPDGTAYLAVREEGNQSVQLLRSRDQFETWEGPFRVSPATHTLNNFAVVSAGDAGRVAVAYLGTHSRQRDAAMPMNASIATKWHVYVSTSFDADSESPHFYTQRVTPKQDPVHQGCIVPVTWDGSPWGARSTYPGWCINVHAVFTIAQAASGRTYVAFTDGCTPRNGCTGDTASGFQARDRQVGVAVLDQGFGLRDGDPLPGLGLVHPAAYGPDCCVNAPDSEEDEPSVAPEAKVPVVAAPRPASIVT